MSYGTNGTRRRKANDDPSIGAYISEINKIPLLSREEEIALTTQIWNLRNEVLSIAIKSEYGLDYLLNAGQTKADEETDASGNLFFGERADKKDVRYVVKSIRNYQLLPKKEGERKMLKDIAEKVCSIAVKYGEVKNIGEYVRGRSGPKKREKLEDVLNRYEHTKEAMSKANLRLVISIAKGWYRETIPFLDLIQEGNLGLMKAVELYDPRTGSKFGTYATWWIKNRIRRFHFNQKEVVRKPVYLIELLAKREREGRNGANGHSNGQSSVGVNGGLLNDATRRVISLTQSDNNDSDRERTIGDILEARTPPPEEQEENRELIENMLNYLREKERVVISMRYGLGGEKYKLREIGKRLGITRERVRQIEADAVKKLKRRFVSGE